MKTTFKCVLQAFAGLSLFLLFSCGSSLSGEKYRDANGVSEIEFKSSDKAYVKIMGQTMEAEYSVDDDKVFITIDGQKRILTINESGNISGFNPFGGDLIRVKD